MGQGRCPSPSLMVNNGVTAVFLDLRKTSTQVMGGPDTTSPFTLARGRQGSLDRLRKRNGCSAGTTGPAVRGSLFLGVAGVYSAVPVAASTILHGPLLSEKIGEQAIAARRHHRLAG